MHLANSAIKRSLIHNNLNDYIPIPLPTPQRVELWGLIESSNGQSCLTHQVCGKQVKVDDILGIHKIQVKDGWAMAVHIVKGGIDMWRFRFLLCAYQVHGSIIGPCWWYLLGTWQLLSEEKNVFHKPWLQHWDNFCSHSTVMWWGAVGWTQVWVWMDTAKDNKQLKIENKKETTQ